MNNNEPDIQRIKHALVDFITADLLSKGTLKNVSLKKPKQCESKREWVSAESHLEDVSGVGQRRGQDARHHAAEDVDDHGLIWEQRYTYESHTHKHV